MTAADLTRAKRDAEQAKGRFAAAADDLKTRLRPGAIASHAWAGVKDRGGALADDAFDAVKSRPITVAGTVAALAIFLARDPIWSLATRWLGKDEESDAGSDEAAANGKDDKADAPRVRTGRKQGVSA